MKTIFLTLCLGVLVVNPLRAMDRFEALSMLESGDNDRAIGPSGEVSRYQVMPNLWKFWNNEFKGICGTNDCWNPTNTTDALVVADLIMTGRVKLFQKFFHHAPSDQEWYLLWHCPARVEWPTAADADLARRFANLCQRP